MLEKWWRRCWFKSADKPGGCGLGIEWLTLAGSTQLILIPQRIAGWLPVTPKMPHIDRPQQLNHLLYILKVTSVQPKQLRWLYCGVCGLGVVASTDRTFSGTASIRLGSWEHAGQINALSWRHWHWGVAWRFFFLGPQVFRWVVCVNCQIVASYHECQDPFSRQNIDIALDDQGFTFPRLQRVCSVPVTGVPDLCRIVTVGWTETNCLIEKILWFGLKILHPTSSFAAIILTPVTRGHPGVVLSYFHSSPIMISWWGRTPMEPCPAFTQASYSETF